MLRNLSLSANLSCTAHCKSNAMMLLICIVRELLRSLFYLVCRPLRCQLSVPFVLRMMSLRKGRHRPDAPNPRRA